ncbi:hypothetical protein F511_38073 [Dorcoceras hygrometricum]|uniref:Uncharacterized protein n=1 Tax=Dorcoceras hygrometricum TaxID=472368 RepID=A0A2Z7CA41_9LAMI|nr:hypothetical protein F511_38073 [Dorcoceras hygrometricum]
MDIDFARIDGARLIGTRFWSNKLSCYDGIDDLINQEGTGLRYDYNPFIGSDQDYGITENPFTESSDNMLNAPGPPKSL